MRSIAPWGVLAGLMLGCGGGGATDTTDGSGEPDAAGRRDGGGVLADAAGDPCAEPGVTCYYLAPDGDDAAAGTLEAPWFSLNRAWQVVAPGDVIYLRGGTYDLAQKPVLTGKSGTADAMIRVWNYPGERPVLQPGPAYVLEEYVGIFFIGDYVHFRGLELTGFVNVDSFVARALRAEASSYNIFERLDVHHNGAGLLIQDLDGGGGYSTGNLVINSDFHHNADPNTGYGNADGMGINYIFGPDATNTIRGCRAWNNSDDGFDVFANNGHVLIEDTWSWHNGYIPDTETPGGDGDGFKLGITEFHDEPILRTIRRSVAFANRLTGFHQEEADARMALYNNTAYGNGAAGFNLYNIHDRAHVLQNNVAVGNGVTPATVSPSSTSDHNGADVADAATGWAAIAGPDDFISIDPTGLDGPRAGDGGLPDLPFLRLAAGSDLIDAGVDVGDAFSGAAPDLGAFER